MNDNFYKMSFWQTNPVSKVFSFFLKAIHYQPPQAVRQFILAEKSPSVNEVKPIDTEEDAQKAALKNSGQILRDHLNYAQEFAGFLEDAICELKNNKPTGGQKINNEIYKLTQKKAELSLPLRSFDTSLPPEDRLVSSDLNENKNILEKLYHLPENSDLIFHFFAINSAPPEQAMLIFLDGMVNKEIIDLAILQPLTLFFAKSRTSQLTAGSIKNHLPNHILKTETSYQEISRAVNSGDTVLFLDGLNEAFILDSKGYEHRGVGKADIEKSLQGTQSAFTEVIQVNTSMLRSLLPTSDLVKESLTVGDRVETACAVMYLKSIANENLVKEVKRRLQGIRTDYLIDIGTLSQFIEEQPNAFFPKSLQTERPDRTALLLTEGRVAIFLNGAPFAMIVPVN
ncbi:MAG: spore germination protein, partial [Sporomusaceae bacterium]|nr:spore germination protein [Sporomusaceae bacterium]